MKIIAILGLAAVVICFSILIDEKNGWIDKTKRWIRSKLGLCNHLKHIRYEDEYSKPDEPYFHHTYKITYCVLCGKIFSREKMQ